MADRKSQVIPTHTVQAYLIQPTDDGKQMAIVLKTGPDTAAYAFSPADFARFAARVLEVAASNAPGRPPDNGVQTVSLPVEEVSFESDPATPSLVKVGSRIGRLRLDLSLETNTLLQSVKQFLDARGKARATRQ
jgi:hypothetical protein